MRKQAQRGEALIAKPGSGRGKSKLSVSDIRASFLCLSRYLSQVRVKPPFLHQSSGAQVGMHSDSGEQ